MELFWKTVPLWRMDPLTLLRVPKNNPVKGFLGSILTPAWVLGSFYTPADALESIDVPKDEGICSTD